MCRGSGRTIPLSHLTNYNFFLQIKSMDNTLIDFLLTVKAATKLFISGLGSAVSFNKEGESGFVNNFVKS